MGISLEQALKRCDFLAPLGAFPRHLTLHRLAGKCCQSGVGRFLKVFGRCKPESYQAHSNIKPAEFQRVLYVDIGPEMKLNLLGLVS